MAPTLDDEIDALFQAPLTEFTAARNALASRLKKAGRIEEAERVKALSKPPVSAWAVNQLYWKHRESFGQLISAVERLGKAHAEQAGGKPADVSGLLAARRDALTHLLRLADALLRDRGHGAAPDTMRRISTTLEALSTYALFSDATQVGRLTHDLDPPGFESLAALIPAAPRRDVSVQPFPKAAPRQEASPAKVAAAKARLQAAEQALREAESRFEKAKAAAEEAQERAKRLADEADAAAQRLKDAERSVEQARQDLRQRDRPPDDAAI